MDKRLRRGHWQNQATVTSAMCLMTAVASQMPQAGRLKENIKKVKKNQDANPVEEVEISDVEEVIVQISDAEETEDTTSNEENNQVCCINWQYKNTHS